MSDPLIRCVAVSTFVWAMAMTIRVQPAEAQAAPGNGEPAQDLPSDRPAAGADEPPVQPAPPVPPHASVTSRWDTSIYGFAEFDAIHDSTQSFLDQAGNQAIARPALYAQNDQGEFVWQTNLAGKHGRTTFSVRDSRIGFKVSAPTFAGIHPSAILEMDFLGNQPKITYPETIASTSGRLSGGSEASFYTSPDMRVRHAAIRLDNAYLDVLLGQYWQLFGWQGSYQPATVEIQGLPGQVFGRAPQIRLSHTFRSEYINFDVAVAAARPPQRNAELPDGQAGLRLAVNKWLGLHTSGATGTGVDPMSVGVSGTARQFQIPVEVGIPLDRNKINGWGVSVDALIPIIPATMASRGNALTLTGSFVTGYGISDHYAGLTGGSEFPRIATPPGATTPPVWPQDIDSGIVTYDANGKLIAINWQSFMVGLEYHLPPAGALWLSVNYSHLKSNNIAKDLDPTIDPWTVFTESDWADANLFWDAAGPVRLGIEYAYFRQTYADNQKVFNSRAQLSAWYMF